MAELRKIEDMSYKLDYAEPAWIRGYAEPERENHLSGALREAIDELIWKNRSAQEGLNKDEAALAELLEEAAETLDDAHQEWLERELLNRKRRYIVIGRVPDMENEIVVYDDVEDGGHAERKFSAALDEMKDAEDITTPGYHIEFVLEISCEDGSVFYSQDQFGFHGNTREEAK